ncbi:hypothetical protein [Martelella mangrovi]|uniref:Uncharacterized protein YgbK (DUF1537 family) n=1 Tax=Martelella mangrovi TaxID=1397477 RepID=A0ABV2IE45_9HYPH
MHLQLHQDAVAGSVEPTLGALSITVAAVEYFGVACHALPVFCPALQHITITSFQSNSFVNGVVRCATVVRGDPKWPDTESPFSAPLSMSVMKHGTAGGTIRRGTHLAQGGRKDIALLRATGKDVAGKPDEHRTFGRKMRCSSAADQETTATTIAASAITIATTKRSHN